jgi:hypothetical protein
MTNSSSLAGGRQRQLCQFLKHHVNRKVTYTYFILELRKVFQPKQNSSVNNGQKSWIKGHKNII